MTEVANKIDKRVFRLIARKIEGKFITWPRVARVIDFPVNQQATPFDFGDLHIEDKLTEIFVKVEEKYGTERVWKLIEKFIDPINLKGDPEESSELADGIDKILRLYTNYCIPPWYGAVMTKEKEDEERVQYMQSFEADDVRHEEEKFYFDKETRKLCLRSSSSFSNKIIGQQKRMLDMFLKNKELYATSKRLRLEFQGLDSFNGTLTRLKNALEPIAHIEAKVSKKDGRTKEGYFVIFDKN